MKIAISVPDPVFHAAEMLAANLNKSRSQLYAEALASYVSSHSAHDVTQRLNAVYGRESSKLDDAWVKLQSRSVSRETW
jgi:metal-responsive CopG/Arc/MetJ family transcriptional regulator